MREVMTESRFLTAVENYLSAASLVPAPALIGDVEPIQVSELPAVVLSLEETTRKGSGLGQRTITIENGCLPVTRGIDLANPVLEEGSDFSLVSEDRLHLTLPHGGLVHADGSTGALSDSDLTVTVAGAGQAVVADALSAGQVSVDHLTGQLTFGAPLPAAGIVEASYFLGSWEQTVVRLQGVLRVDICSGAINDVRQLTAQVRDALLDDAAASEIQRLLKVDVAGMGTIGPDSTIGGSARRRPVRFSFTFDEEIDMPESSGGIIQRVPVVTNLTASEVDSTGAINTSVVTESDLT